MYLYRYKKQVSQQMYELKYGKVQFGKLEMTNVPSMTSKDQVHTFKSEIKILYI